MDGATDNRSQGKLNKRDHLTKFQDETLRQVNPIATGLKPGRIVLVMKREKGLCNWVTLTDAIASSEEVLILAPKEKSHGTWSQYILSFFILSIYDATALILRMNVHSRDQRGVSCHVVDYINQDTVESTITNSLTATTIFSDKSSDSVEQLIGSSFACSDTMKSKSINPLVHPWMVLTGKAASKAKTMLTAPLRMTQWKQ